MNAQSFKEQIQADISNVFLNGEEFGALHTVNGKQLTAVIDDNELLERDKSRVGMHTDGLYQSRRLLYVKKADYGPRPAVGAALSLDGRMCRVKGCTEEAGVLAIEVEAVKT